MLNMNATKKFVYTKISAMNIKEDNINMIKRLSYNLLCSVDTIVRTNIDKGGVLSCKECIYQDTKELGYTGCPLRQSLKEVLK